MKTKKIYFVYPYNHSNQDMVAWRVKKAMECVSDLESKGFNLCVPDVSGNRLSIKISQIRQCDEIYILILGDWQLSEEIKEVRKIAAELGKPVKEIY